MSMRGKCMDMREGGESWIKNAGREKTDTGQDGQAGPVRILL